MEKAKVYDDAVEDWNNKPGPDKTWPNVKLFWLQEYLKKKNRPSSTMGQTFQGIPFANLADGEFTDNEGKTNDDDLSSVTQDAFARMEVRLAAMESGQQV